MSGGIVGVLLGAGQGARFRAACGNVDEDKLMQRLPDGRRVIEASAATLCAALEEVVLVVAPGFARDQCRFAPKLRVLEAAASREGMGHSLAAGIAAAADATGWVVALADMPALRVDTVIALANALRSGQVLVAPVLNGRRGHPVGFGAAFGAELRALQGDTGARAILTRHAGRLHCLACTDPGIFQDVDTPDDLRALPCT